VFRRPAAILERAASISRLGRVGMKITGVRTFKFWVDWCNWLHFALPTKPGLGTDLRLDVIGELAFHPQPVSGSTESLWR
jgi:hypothetical protein